MGINIYSQVSTSGSNDMVVNEKMQVLRKCISHKGLDIFIVHGHDDVLRYELKNYLQNTLNLPEPIVLSERPSHGLTIIEKFEENSEKVGFVFVLMTPDDLTSEAKVRARQNVIFELGYFMGKLGRKSGRIILLHKGNVEIPSDLSGIVYINVDNGIRSVGEDIRQAISDIDL